jgi:nucleotide-binding universal stress UspA family protein
MFQLQTILFPVDFSDACQAASEEVAATAAHFGAKLLLFHVVQMQPVWYGDAVGYSAVIDMDEVIDAKRSALSEVLRDRDDLEIRRVVACGDPAQAIVECARSQGVDLIMMPTRGCGPFRRFLLGSVTAKVLHDVECPVWTDTHQQQFEAHESCRSVLCAVDLRPEMVPALQWAAEFSHSEEADLRLIHAIPWYEDGHGEAASLRHVVDDARDSIAGLEQQAGVEAPVFIKPGSVAQVLREAALKYAANLIVIGQGSLHKLMGRLRTSAYAIVREAPCPVVRV